MADAPRPPHSFKYETPVVERGKTIMWLARTDILFADVQILKDGGETNLHSHSHLDGFWMVLSGRARFYGEGDVVIAEIGRHEGVLIPRGCKYWFESASEEPLEILQVAASVVPMRSSAESRADRIDYTPPKPSLVGTE